MADAHVASLAERMAEALRDKPINKRKDRLIAYHDAGIHFWNIPDDELFAADAIAEVQELSRRLTQ